MKKLIILVMTAMACGCTTERKATNYLNNHLNVAAKFCADKFPNKETLKPGKTDTVVTHDTITVEGESIECPPAKDGKTVYVKCPDQKIITKYVDRFRVDTIETKGAEYAVLTNNYEAVKDSLLIVKQDLKNEKEKSSTRAGWIWKLGIALAILSVLGALKFIGRI